jgi:hypothetical protein
VVARPYAVPGSISPKSFRSAPARRRPNRDPGLLPTNRSCMKLIIEAADAAEDCPAKRATRIFPSGESGFDRIELAQATSRGASSQAHDQIADVNTQASVTRRQAADSSYPPAQRSLKLPNSAYALRSRSRSRSRWRRNTCMAQKDRPMTRLFAKPKPRASRGRGTSALGTLRDLRAARLK